MKAPATITAWPLDGGSRVTTLGGPPDQAATYVRADLADALAEALRDLVQEVTDMRESFCGLYSGPVRTEWQKMEEGAPMDAWLSEYRRACAALAAYEEARDDRP